MTTRHDDQAVMYIDTADTSRPNDTAPLDTTHATHNILGPNGETTTDNSDDTPS